MSETGSDFSLPAAGTDGSSDFSVQGGSAPAPRAKRARVQRPLEHDSLVPACILLVSDARLQTPGAILEKVASQPNRGQSYDGCVAAVAVCFIS